MPIKEIIKIEYDVICRDIFYIFKVYKPPKMLGLLVIKQKVLLLK